MRRTSSGPEFAGIERLVGIHRAGRIGVGGDLPAGEVDRLQPGADHLHGLVAGERAEAVDEVLLAQGAARAGARHARRAYGGSGASRAGRDTFRCRRAARCHRSGPPAHLDQILECRHEYLSPFLRSSVNIFTLQCKSRGELAWSAGNGSICHALQNLWLQDVNSVTERSTAVAERKIFAGARLRRLRQRLGLSQTQMAAELGVSPSYLNLIERNQRPLTVQVLLKLSAVYGVDVAELSGEDGDRRDRNAEGDLLRSAPRRRGRLAGGALGIRGSGAERRARHGAAARGLSRGAGTAVGPVAPHGARRAKRRPEAAARLPAQGVAAYFEEAGPWFPRARGGGRGRSPPALPARRPGAGAEGASSRGVRRRSPHPAGARSCRSSRRRYDRHSLRLFISERVPLMERPFLMARQARIPRQRDLLDRLTPGSRHDRAGSGAPLPAGFARRLAEAILAPAEPASPRRRASSIATSMRLSRALRAAPVAHHGAAGGGRSDGAAAFRRPSCILLDASGGVLRRMPGAGFPLPRFGAVLRQAADLRRNAHRRGRPRLTLELPDGGGFRVGRVAEEGARGQARSRRRRDGSHDRLAARRTPRCSMRRAGRAGATDRRHLPALRAARLRPPHPALRSRARRAFQSTSSAHRTMK